LSRIDPRVRANIVTSDLKKQGITDYGTSQQSLLFSFSFSFLGELESGELNDCANNKLELFVDGEPMDLARYPNFNSQGYPQFMRIQKKIDDNTFTYNGTRPEKWTNETDLWLHWYWSFGWADSYVQVSSIDISKKEFHTNTKTPPLYGYKDKAR